MGRCQGSHKRGCSGWNSSRSEGTRGLRAAAFNWYGGISTLVTSIGSLVSQVIKASACNAGDMGSIPGSRRSPGEGNGNPLQFSCLKIPWMEESRRLQSMGVAKSRTLLSDFTFTFIAVINKASWQNLSHHWAWLWRRHALSKTQKALAFPLSTPFLHPSTGIQSPRWVTHTFSQE